MIENHNLLVICGGKSAEHEISIRSARSIVTGVQDLNEEQIFFQKEYRKRGIPISVLEDAGYNVFVVMISRSGTWYWLNNIDDLAKITHCNDMSLYGEVCALVRNVDQTSLVILNQTRDRFKENESVKIDIVFPILHGPMGEDGTIQGLLEMMELPYVGSGVLASAIGMNKRIMKKCLADAGLPVVPYISGNYQDMIKISYNDITQQLSSNILFVKPLNLGSSVGISKVYNEKEYLEALELAFKYDQEIIVEKYIECREIECSIIGNEEPRASILGEIIPNHDFYSYDAKYTDPNGATLEIPASLEDDFAKEIRNLAKKAFSSISASGMARVDIFVDKNSNEIYINEINTIPGFTSISMYPKLWEEAGTPFPFVILRLLELAWSRHDEKKLLHLYR